MAVFVDFSSDDEDPQDVQPQQHAYGRSILQKSGWKGERTEATERSSVPDEEEHNELSNSTANGSASSHYTFRNAMTEALGCYPVAMAIASSLDLISLDNLSRTCRQIHASLLEYRSPLKSHTLHCVNENVEFDPDDTLRYRARTGNWYYMEELARPGDKYNGKSGQCARDMVAECRRCARVVCRNCAIKPPAPIALRDRHRRLCIRCTKAPVGTLAKPSLRPDTSIDADIMKRAVCTCQSEGVWLCQPCGRSIRGADHDYQSIWRWRNQYGDIIGGLGTGIGDGDRGVICGREGRCCAAKEREHETDCDAADAREHVLSNPGTPPPANPHPYQSWMTSSDTSSPSPSPSSSPDSRRTPSPPHLGPGYARHEIEGIGGVVKTKRLSMVRVGACVPEWEDEKNNGQVLGREVSGRSRSWCGWCTRVIPGKKDYEQSAQEKGYSSLPVVKADG
ncbi:hypothetical protein BKA67DRAFT_561084 [Truncatella angustata]|uniref:Uncharacterized protein n=1 Tax=Truncatella angustata TaxID=152316 RepID=A0A9P8UNQ6_9PEZI|nr:uncharacterized protein BKA67DRAFT_561084 [Truncatella angustata]KAH6655563.1 hypothetical protein BKA67DRAFT_561084 [Truncatella angustata]